MLILSRLQAIKGSKIGSMREYVLVMIIPDWYRAVNLALDYLVLTQVVAVLQGVVKSCRRCPG